MSKRYQRRDFRRWLISQIKLSQWTKPERSFEELAPQLGVQVDVLEEAQRELNAERAKEGFQAVQLGAPRRHLEHCIMVEIGMPVEVWADWTRYKEARQWQSSVMLRSLIHQSLVTGEDPVAITRPGWIYRGQRYYLDSKMAKKWPSAKASITVGAHTALMRRCAKRNVLRADFMRALVLDLLEGRITKLLLVSTDAMWGDPDRYVC